MKRLTAMGAFGHPLSRPSTMKDTAMSLALRGCDQETITRTMLSWAASAAEEAWQWVQAEGRRTHPEAGGDYCTEGADGCCTECGVSMTGDACMSCSGTAYHRPGCKEMG